MNELNICPVCGYDSLLYPPYDKHGYPSYEICPCCGFEYGYDDSDKKISFYQYQETWIRNGFNFNNMELKPSDWSREKMEQQLINLKKVNYKPRL